MAEQVEARAVFPGAAEGRAVVIEPLSFWGGVDPGTGVVVDPHHPGFGTALAGCVVVMAHGVGSSSSSSVLAELLRSGSGPAAIVLEEPDAIIFIGVAVAAELYGAACPVLIVPGATRAIRHGAGVAIDGARVRVVKEPPRDGV